MILKGTSGGMRVKARHIVPFNPQSTEAQLFSSGHPTNGNPLRETKCSIPSSSFRGFRGMRGKKRDARAREDPLAATQLPALSIFALSSAFTTSALRLRRRLPPVFLPFGEREKEKIGFRFSSRNLKPQLLWLSLNASQFSAAAATTRKPIRYVLSVLWFELLLSSPA